MSVDPFSDAIKEAYANVDTDELVLSTLEIHHETFTEPVRVVRDHGVLLEAGAELGDLDIYGYEMKLEDDADQNPGEKVRFVRCMFRFDLPDYTAGSMPVMRLTLDNVSRDLVEYLDIAVETRSNLSLTYREYLASDLDTVQYQVKGMRMKRVRTTVSTVTADAAFKDLANVSFPGLTYDPDRYAGLVQ